MNTNDLQQRQATGPGRHLRGLAGLLLLSGAATLAVNWMESNTRSTITANEQAHALEILSAVLPADSYDNQPAADVILVSDSALLGSQDAQPAYTARSGDDVIASILTVTAPMGYVAPIRLLVGITPNGQITGVRAILHSETPGLGDRIDADKDNWILGFARRQFDDQTLGIALRDDGGDIDHISGATITSRAVTNAVANALRFHSQNRALLIAPPNPDAELATAP